MTPTHIEHAVFATSRHGDGGTTVRIVGSFGTLGIVVPAPGHAELMTEGQTIEALRNALGAMGEASERLKEHIHALDPDGDAPHEPEAHIPLNARFA